MGCVCIKHINKKPHGNKTALLGNQHAKKNKPLAEKAKVLFEVEPELKGFWVSEARNAGITLQKYLVSNLPSKESSPNDNRGFLRNEFKEKFQELMWKSSYVNSLYRDATTNGCTHQEALIEIIERLQETMLEMQEVNLRKLELSTETAFILPKPNNEL